MMMIVTPGECYEVITNYDTIRYDTAKLTCSKKVTISQFRLPHGTNTKCKRRTENKLMSIDMQVKYLLQFKD